MMTYRSEKKAKTCQNVIKVGHTLINLTSIFCLKQLEIVFHSVAFVQYTTSNKFFCNIYLPYLLLLHHNLTPFLHNNRLIVVAR